MLKELRLNCERKADSVLPKELNWRKCDKNLLFNLWSDVEKTNPGLADAYVAAILVRYWHTIGINVRRGSGMCPDEECFNWLVDALMYTLEHKAWLDPSKTVYGDPNGPDKCLNLKLSCTRKVFYLYSNSQKRKDDFGNKVSLDGLMEVCGDAELSKLSQVSSKEMVTENDPLIFGLVVDEFKHQNYMASFIIDGIVNGDVFNSSVKKDGVYTEFSRNKLTRHINLIDDAYIKLFSKKYELDELEVRKAAEECQQIKSVKIKKILESTFDKLRVSLRETNEI